MHADVCLDEAFAAMTDFYLESLWFDFIQQNFFPPALFLYLVTIHLKENSAPLLVL